MQLKKILAVFLAVALNCSAALFGVSAENTETFKVGVEAMTATPISSSPTIFDRTEDVSVKIGVSQNTGISFLRFIVTYDAEAFEYVEHSSQKLFGEGESIQSYTGYVIYHIDLVNEVSTHTGELFEITLTPKDGFCGNTEISAELAQGREINCSKYYSQIENTAVPFESDIAGVQVHSIDPQAGVVTAPTCTTDGYTTYTCANCGMVVGNVISATGHDYSAEWTTDVKPTCTQAGSQSHHCTLCEDKADVTEIPAFGHNWTVAEHKDATCTEDGYDDYVCQNDATHTKHEEIVATDHDYSTEWTTDVEPTCTQVGSQSHHCTLCEDKADVTEIPMLEHAFGEWTTEKAPTFTEEGSEVRICGKCDAEEHRAISRLPIQLGDVNLDGDVTAEDALMALQAATDKIVLTEEQTTAANVDQQGEVTAGDALLILQYATKKIGSF